MSDVLGGVPTNSGVMEDNPKSKLMPPWFNWIQQLYSVAFSIQQSGPTLERPVKLLWLGRRYWDTDLQRPVYVASTDPVVWKDAAGAAA